MDLLWTLLSWLIPAWIGTIFGFYIHYLLGNQRIQALCGAIEALEAQNAQLQSLLGYKPLGKEVHRDDPT